MMITAQDYIKSILEALEDSIQGKVLQLLCNIDYDIGIKNSWIQFTPKDSSDYKQVDALWLGFFINEYV